MAEWAYGLQWEHADSGVHFSSIFPGYVTEVGMFAKFGVTPPGLQGSCTPGQVVQAVVDAIEKNKADVVVNSFPLRTFFGLRQFSPGLGAWIHRTSGGIDFQRKKVEVEMQNRQLAIQQQVNATRYRGQAEGFDSHPGSFLEVTAHDP